MSTTRHCFLCLTDEGVFLNITSTNYNSLRGDVEAFLSLKVEKKNNSNKVCHKCAFELKQCSDFLKKYKGSRTTVSETNKSSKKNVCAFCLETGINGYVFRISRRIKSLNYPTENLLSNLKEYFQDEFFNNKTGIILICLTCRYSLDILFDLKSLYVELSEARSVFNKNSDYSTIPKVKTIMVKRKTTIPVSMRTRSYVLNNANSDSNKKEENSAIKINKDESTQAKPRTCDSCKTNIKDGEDMYRFYKTGLTVCKTCWTSMDPSKSNKRKRKTQSDTKLCAVFLKDVLSDVPIKKEQKGYKIEKDSDGNNIYIITDSESDLEADKTYKTDSDYSQEKYSRKLNTRSKRAEKRSQINLLSDSSDNEIKNNKKIKTDIVTETTIKNTKMQNKKSIGRTFESNKHYSDTDVMLSTSSEIVKEKETKKKRSRKVYSESDCGIRKSQRTNNRNKRIIETIKEDDSSVGDLSLTDDDIKGKKLNQPSTSNLSKKVTKSRKRLRSNSTLMSIDENALLITKRSVKSRKLLQETSFENDNLDEKLNLNDKKDLSKKKDLNEKKDLIEKKDSSEKKDLSENKDLSDNKIYNCRECGVTFENKLKVITHELTHFKTLELKLNKLMIDNKNKDITEKNDELINDESSEQQNEDINLSVEDDEEFDTVTDVLDQNKLIKDTTDKEDTELNLSLTENEEKNSLEVDDTNKNDTKESKSMEIIDESICKENNLDIDNENKKLFKDVLDNEVSSSVQTENNNTSKDNNKEENDSPVCNPIEDNTKSDEKKNEINEEIKDKSDKEVNENIERVESNIDQSENHIKEKEEDKTMESEEKQDKIMNEEEKQDKIMNEEEKQEKIMNEEEKQDKIMNEEEKHDKIMNDEEELDKIMDDEEELDKIMDDEELDKILDDEEKLDKILDDEEEKDKRIDLEEEKDKIIDLEEEKDKIIDLEEEKDKIIDLEEEKDKIIDLEEEKDKIIDLEEEKDKIIDLEEEKDKIIDLVEEEEEEEEEKTIDVEEEETTIDVNDEQEDDETMEVKEENAKEKEDTTKDEDEDDDDNDNMIKDKKDNAKEIENNTNERSEDDETEESYDKEEIIKEIEIIKESKDKTKEIEITKIEEQNNTVLNEDNNKLNDRVHSDDINRENLKQKDDKSIEDKENDKNETDKEIFDKIDLEISIENNILKSDKKSTIDDDSDSIEEVVKQVEKQLDISITTTIDSEVNKEHINDAQKLLDDLTYSSNEHNSSNEIGTTKKNNKESVNTPVKVLKQISNLPINEQENSSVVDDSNLRDNQREAETLENITLEIQKSADMPSLIL